MDTKAYFIVVKLRCVVMFDVDVYLLVECKKQWSPVGGLVPVLIALAKLAASRTYSGRVNYFR